MSEDSSKDVISQGISVIPFALQLPTTTLQEWDEPTTPKGDTVSLMGENGIVGSIVLMGNKSAMIWVGWGQLKLMSGEEGSDSNVAHSIFGSGAPTMGQLVVAMPRTTYRGAFGSSSTAAEPSCSLLVGGASSEDEMLAHQMASRLSARSGRAIFVSCQLSQAPSLLGGAAGGGNAGAGGDFDGLDSDMVTHRAAALAEKEIWRVLQEQTSK